MKTKKLVKNAEYYVLCGDRWYPSFGVFRARFVGRANYPFNSDLVVMKQNIDGIEHCFEAAADNIYPLKTSLLGLILHNERQRRLGIEHDKSFDMSNACERISGWIHELPEYQQKDLIAIYKSANPHLIGEKGEILKSKFKLRNWDELNCMFLRTKYPLVDIPE